MLLRVFCAFGRHHSLSDYNRGVPPSELQIYTWLDLAFVLIDFIYKSTYLTLQD